MNQPDFLDDFADNSNYINSNSNSGVQSQQQQQHASSTAAAILAAASAPVPTPAPAPAMMPSSTMPNSSTFNTTLDFLDNGAGNLHNDFYNGAQLQQKQQAQPAVTTTAAPSVSAHFAVPSGSSHENSSAYGYYDSAQQQAPPPATATTTTMTASSSANLLILHVYELQPDPSLAESQQQTVSTTDRALLFMSSILPTIGMGAYHTSLEIQTTGCKYTFVGNVGIMVSKSNAPDVGVPNGAKYTQAITLGPTIRNKNDILQITKTLSTLFFTPQSYNFIHRNCNHFTECLATALLMTEPPKHDNARLLTYPKWLNRLAKTGALVYGNDSDQSSSSSDQNQQIGPCNVLQEATISAGF